MGSVRKYKDKYRAEVCINGIRKSKVFRLKKDANIWINETELTLNREGIIQKVSVKDIFIRYRDEVSKFKKGGRWEYIRINALLREDFTRLPSDLISAKDISSYRDKRLKTVKTSTVNRELNLISAIFSRARNEWKYLYKNPVQGVKRPKDPPHRTRLISDEEIELIVLALGYSDGIKLKRQLVAVIFLIALETAMRLDEICRLRKDDVIDDVAVLIDTKNGDRREVPLSKNAQDLFKIVFESGLTITNKQASAIFMKYKPINDIHFHDSRHTAITRLSKVLDILPLAKMVGHRDIKNLMIYYNESASDIAKKL